MKCSSSRIKNFLILWEMELCTSDIFSKKCVSYIFSKERFSYIWGNETFLYFRKRKKCCYISGSNFPSSKSKKNPLIKSFLYLGKWNFLASSLKIFLIFQEATWKAWKSKISHFLFVERELFKHKHKRNKFLLLFLIKKQDILN